MRAVQSIRWRPLIAPVMLVIAALASGPRNSSAADNLLRNGDFSEGSGDTPAYWTTQSWIEMPTTTYMWIKPSGGEAGVIAIQSRADNDARWVQSVYLSPGWYYVGAELHTVEVGNGMFQSGAMVGLMELGVVHEGKQEASHIRIERASSRQVTGDTDWQKRGFYLKVDGTGAEVQIALRLGYFESPNTGLALFRGASVVAIDAPPPDAGPRIDLDATRRHFAGNRWSILLALIPLLIGSAGGWIILGRYASRRKT